MEVDEPEYQAPPPRQGDSTKGGDSIEDKIRKYTRRHVAPSAGTNSTLPT